MSTPQQLNEPTGSKGPEPLDPANQPPVDRYCDVILKGGVIDGVIYPWAIMELAKYYRFKNIGGTSVGALAAALTAAAEYSRRYGSVNGFNNVMLEIPGKLAKESTPGQTKLFSLFQPTNNFTRRLFEVFISFFGSPKSDSAKATRSAIDALKKAYDRWIKWGVVAGLIAAIALAIPLDMWRGIFSGSIKFHPPTPIFSLLICVQFFIVIFCAGLLVSALRNRIRAWFLFSIFLSIGTAITVIYARPDLSSRAVFGIQVLALTIVCVAIAIVTSVGLQIVRDICFGLVPKGFGLCTGKQIANGSQGLIEWLHEGIQGAAGRPFDCPLTFRDLWTAPCGPTPGAFPPNRVGFSYRSIDLKMVTTNITHGRPYGLPLTGEMDALFFLEQELALYFPDEVIKHLCLHAPIVDKLTLHRQLPGADLPIVVAARLSLSFPILFKAVPLWARNTKGSTPAFVRCWFSDGGICSNFPINQFDAALPRWPTFGIMLGNATAPNGDEVWITDRHDEGLEEGLASKVPANLRKTDNQCFALELPEKGQLLKGASDAISRLIKFGADILYAAKDWNDNTSVRLPGVRDRVVHVRLPDLGGLNLRLSSREILHMAEVYGSKAGQLLVRKFLTPGAPSSQLAVSQAWHEHRWVRFNTFVTALRARLAGFTCAEKESIYSESLATQIQRALNAAPLRDENLTQTQCAALNHALSALLELEKSLIASNPVQSYQPQPQPEIQLRTPL